MTDMQQDLGQEIVALKNRLERAGVSTSEWGKGEAKTLRHLVQELKEGDCLLVEVDGKLIRTVTVGGADVLFETREEAYRLIEEKQVFTDGRERRRNLGCAVSEKMKPGEDPLQAMSRGIREELGINDEIALLYDGESAQTIESPSYPGLTSQYINHRFTAFLTAEQFKSDGYVEVQGDKSTFFTWQKLIPQSIETDSAVVAAQPQSIPAVEIVADVTVSTASAIVVSKHDPYLILVADSEKHPRPVIPGGKVEHVDCAHDAATPGLRCILREVKQEIGAELRNPRYLGKATDPDRDIRLVPAKKVMEAVVVPALPSGVSEDATVRAHYGCPDYIFVGEVDEATLSRDTEELKGVRFIDIRTLHPGDLSAGHDVIVLTYRDMLDAGETQFPDEALKFFNVEREAFTRR
jgi:ADP-ribose pyrophosphatase YjhB (NUDIX family)